ncbi:MAG TPA: ATP-binding protein [Thermoanaerobaculia bacterium]|nr:ATP-binding protein [Thermoanaerobaculia bacterium]
MELAAPARVDSDQRPATSAPPPRRTRLLFIALLTLLGVAGNVLAAPLFFGVDFLFGSIPVLIVVRLYGGAWGTLAAALAASYTMVLWGHPWGMVIFGLEALVVAALLRRPVRNLLLADGVYWLVLGIPLVALFYGGVMDTEAGSTLLIMLKQSVNGIFNALVASLVLTHTPIRTLASSRLPRVVPLREMLFDLLVAAVLIPALAVMMLGARYELRKLEDDALRQLRSTASSMSSRIENWRDRHLVAIEELARWAREGRSDDPGELQESLQLLHGAFPDFHNIYVADAAGTSIAFEPPTTADGESTLGVSFADRPYYEELVTTRRSVVSDVIVGRAGLFTPIVVLAAPILDARGRFLGYAAGSLNLSDLEQLLRRYALGTEQRITISDSRGRVIASTLPGLRPLETLALEGEIETLEGSAYHRLPAPPGTPAISRWRRSFFGYEALAGSPAWHINLEMPLEPMQDFLQRRHTRSFAVILLLSLLSLLLAAAASSWLAGPLARLAAMTSNLPERLEAAEVPSWPRSRVAEVDSLGRNFRSMGEALEQRFQDLEETRQTLEQRSIELAGANRELETEVAERRRAEAALRLLAGASTALTTSLELEATLERVAEVAVPALADWCVVELLETEDGEDRVLVATAHREPAGASSLRALAAEMVPVGDLPGPAARVMESDAPELVADLLEWTDHGQPGGLGRLLRVLEARSGLFVPLRARGRTLGVMTLVRTADSPAYGDEDLPLAQELARRAALALDNARLYSELQLADRRKDEFLAMLAHELRNPLAPVSTSLLLLRLRQDDPQVVERSLGVMERQVGHIVRLVDDLLDVARITRGKIELKKERVALGDVVGQAVEGLRERFEQRRQRLEVRTTDAPLPVYGDPTRLEQILTNLLSNANKYTEAGGEVTLTLETEDGQAVVRVADSGVGMTPELAGRVFDLFMQADQALDRSQGGLGIGLTLVRQLVAMHGGEVEASSPGPGQGSTFTVRLPLASEPPPLRPPAAGESGEEALVPSRRILVVDDNVEGGETLAALLRQWGHQVTVAYDGRQGLSAAEILVPEVVLLDIGLPGIDGYEVARRLRRLPAARNAKVVAVTGYGRQVHGDRLDEAGFDHLLVKPVRPGELRQVLAEPRPVPG